LPPKVEEKNEEWKPKWCGLPIAPKSKNQDNGKNGELPIAPKNLNLSKKKELKNSPKSLQLPIAPNHSSVELQNSSPELPIAPNPSKNLKNEKKYSCEYCGSSFSKNSNLIKHINKNCKVKKDKLKNLEEENKLLKLKIESKTELEDTKLKNELEQKEQELKLQIEKHKKYKTIVKEKNSALKAKDNVLEEKDNVLKEKDKVLEEKERCINVLLEQTKVLKEKHYTIIHNNMLDMKATKFLNSHCKNNPSIKSVYDKIENSDMTDKQLESLTYGIKFESYEIIALVIDEIMTSKNKEIMADKMITDGTCEGVLFSNDGSRRKYIAKDEDKWCYYENDKYIDDIIYNVAQKACIKSNIPFTLTKPKRNKIIKIIKSKNDYNSKKNTVMNNIATSLNIEKEDPDDEECIRNEDEDEEEIEYEEYTMEVDIDEYNKLLETGKIEAEYINGVMVK